MTKPGRTLGRIVLVTLSAIVGVLLFEVGVRASGLDYNLSPNWKYHPVLGWSQVPNGKYQATVNGNPLLVSFNAMGFRDREHQLAKPPGVKRIVVIGDSFSEAVQVNLEETFHRELEDLLNQGGAEKWEVINLGVGDFGTAQEYIALMQYGLDFQPDIVIHQIFPLNDICNNSIELYDLCRSHNDRYRPYFVESDTGLVETYRQPARTWLRRHAASWNVLEYWALKTSGVDPQSPEDPGRPARLRRRGFQGLDPLLYTYVADSLPGPVAEGWRITEKIIERIVAVTREHGIAYVGMVVPFEIELNGRWNDFAKLQPSVRMDQTYPQQRFAAEFARLGVPSVMLADAFRPYLDEVLPYVGGHLSAAGHRRAAEALYRTLVGAGLAGR